ncbi:MAG TPA: family 16 glycoside hydrolase [Sedimentisphaerales bacterium]|nr:family 16 glycoside hydrolase [Sedimentisphaerales bacterium]
MRKYLGILLLFVCACIYAYSVVNTQTGNECNVSVDTARPVSLVWPCEVSVVGDNGEKGLRIPPKVGRGWCGEAGGQASYRFYVPQSGRYHIWAYCLWFDVCANAIFAQIDDQDRAVLGNDPVYKQWHWVRGFDVELLKGTHTLVLSNHSDHISLQKVLFTSSPLSTPDDCGPVFSDIFYDGFDGCDHGNFADWKVVSGQWTVMDPTRKMCYIENALLGASEDESFVFYKADNWSGYSLNVAVKSGAAEDADGSVGICFGVKDPNQYHQLRWHPTSQSGTVKMAIGSRTGGQTAELASFDAPWEPDAWHQIEIGLNEKKITVRVDSAEVRETPLEHEVTGGIGLRLEGQITAYFDDVHVRAITDNPK